MENPPIFNRWTIYFYGIISMGHLYHGYVSHNQKVFMVASIMDSHDISCPPSFVVQILSTMFHWLSTFVHCFKKKLIKTAKISTLTAEKRQTHIMSSISTIISLKIGYLQVFFFWFIWCVITPYFPTMIDPFYMWRPFFCGPRKQPRTVGLRRLPGIGGKKWCPTVRLVSYYQWLWYRVDNYIQYTIITITYYTFKKIMRL